MDSGGEGEALEAALRVAGVMWSRGLLYRFDSRQDVLQEAACFALTLLRRRPDLRPEGRAGFVATAVRRHLLQQAATAGVVRTPLWATRLGKRKDCRGALGDAEADDLLMERRDSWPDPDLAGELLASLPPDHVDIILHRYWYGLTLREAAAVCGCSRETVRLREAEALVRCRKLAEEAE